MAIYKPTNCTPFLTTFDCRVGPDDDPIFFECRIDSSNRNAVGYSVTVYDENNDQVFPPNTAEEGQPPVYPAPDEHISQIGDLKRLTGAGNAATETPYMIQNSGYSNLNTGINGSYLKFPFILNSSYWKNSTGETDQGTFKSINAVYYDSTTEKLYWYSSVDSGVGKEVSMYNGNTYKWVITLYQGDNASVTPIPVDKTDAYKYFDMQLTTGEVMGSYDERIQTVYSENAYIDYYIEPVGIEFDSGTDFLNFDPTNWKGTLVDLDKAQNTRTRIKNIDSTYGYIYPQMDEYSYPEDTIQRGKAQGYRVYKMGNNPDVLTTTRIVNLGVGDRAIPFDWEDNIADDSTSYGEIRIYSPVESSFEVEFPNGSTTTKFNVANITMSSSSMNPFDLVALNSVKQKEGETEGTYVDDEDSSGKVRWFTQSSSYSINTDTRLLLNAQPSGEVSAGWYTSSPKDGGRREFQAKEKDTSKSIVSSPNNGSMYNGIFVPRYGGSTTVYLKVDGEVKAFNEYLISFDRASDADTWGEIMSKIVYAQGNGSISNKNVQTQAWDDDDKPIYEATASGEINKSAILFVNELPIQLYNYDDKDNENINTVGLIFYSGGECSTSSSLPSPINKLYISPFTGIKRGMYWIEQGNKTALEKRRFIIKYVDEKYWYVTYDDPTIVVEGENENTGTYPIPFTQPERETPYVIKSYFRDSDENPFDLYENPTIDLKVYRDEEHTYDEDAKAPQGKYEDVEPDPLPAYMNPDGSYCLEENYGQTSIVLLRVDRRSIWVEAEYNQSDFISWRSAQWFLYDGVSTNGNLLQSTDTYFDGKLGHQFYGLEENHVYTIVLVLETNSGLTLSKDIQIITDFNIADVTNFPFTLEYQCETHSVYMRFGLSGFILPNLTGAAKGDRVQDLENEDDGTSPEIGGVTYSDYDNGQGWMNIDGTNTNFPDEGVTYQYIVSVLNGEEAAATQMSSKEDEGTFTFESRHIVDATNSWGNIVGFQYISDEEANDAFSSDNQAQIFLPNYNTTYTYDNVEYDYIDDKLLYQMRYQVGDFEGIPTIVDKDTGATISSKGIWGIETSGGNKTTTAPLIVSGWLQEGLSSSDIGYAVRPSGYEVIAINETNAHYSPIEDGSGDHYKESRFDFLGDNESANSDDPIVAWSRRSTIYRNFTVPPKNDPTSEDGGEYGHLYQGPEDGTFHNFQVRTAVNANSWTDYQVIGPNPSLWSDNELERKTIITGGNRTLTWGTNEETISYGNITTQSREVENLDSHWVWDDGSGENDVFDDNNKTTYDVSSDNAKFWVDGDDNGTLKLYHQTEYASSSSSSATWSTTDLRTDMDKYDFTFHMAVKNAFVGVTEDDIQVQVFRGNAQDNTD